MPRDRQRRTASVRVFLLTGVGQNERATLGKRIQELGAVCVKTEHFQSNATHVVCGKLSRSEKFLGALTLGRWVVRPEYVTASEQAGQWLDEVDYEWSSLTVEGHDGLLAAAAKRNRWRASTTTDKIFADWQVAVAMSDARRQAVYKRLLVFGGARVMDLKLPVKNPSKCSENLTYLFSDKTLTPLTTSLQNHGVLCLNADFISDCIVLHPSPEPLDYLLSSGDNSPGDALNDSAGAESATAGSAPSTASNPAERFNSTDDDMLVFSQCMPSQKHVNTLSVKKEKNSIKKENSDCDGVVEIIDVDEEDVNVLSGLEESRCVERGATTADGTVIFCSEMGRAPVSNDDVIIVVSEDSEAEDCLVAAVTSSPSLLSSTTTRKTPAAVRRKRRHDSPVSVAGMTVELKKVKGGPPFKQSLVSATTTTTTTTTTTPRKVQTSLQNWFLPTGKENARKSLDVMDSPARSEREKLLVRKVVRQSREKPVHAHTGEKPAHVHTNNKTVHAHTKEKLVQKIVKVTLKKLSETVQSNCESVKSKKPTPVPAEDDVILISDAVSTIPSLSPWKRGFDLSGVTNNNTTIASRPRQTSLAEACPSDLLEESKKPEDKQNSDGKSNSVFPLGTEQSQNTHDTKRGTPQERDSPSGNKAADGGNVKPDGVHTTSDTQRSRDNQHKQCKTPQKRSYLLKKRTGPHTPSPQRKSFRTTSLVLGPHAVCVLSPRSINQPGFGKRAGKRTVLMKNYLDMLRKKRKTAAPAQTVEEEQSSPQKSLKEEERTEPSPVKRRKTVRGLSVKTERSDNLLEGDQSVKTFEPNKERRISLENESDRLSHLSVHDRSSCEENETGNKRKYSSLTEEDSSATTNSRSIKPPSAISNQNSHSQQRKVSCENSAAESQTSAGGDSGARWLLPSARWRLSHHLPLPKQFDLTGCSSKSRLESLGSKSTAIPESLGLMISSSLDENYFHSALAMAQSAVSACPPSVDLFRQMLVVIKEADSRTVVNQARAVVMSWLDQFPPVTPGLRSVYEEALGLNHWENFRKILENAVTASETVAGPCCGEGMVLGIVMTALEKNFLHFAHNVSRQGRYNCLIVRCLWSPSYQVYPNGRTRDLMTFLERALKCHNSPQACWAELLSLVGMATQCCYVADRGWRWSVDGHTKRCSTPMVHSLTQAITGGGAESAARLQQVLCSVTPPWLLRQVTASLLGDYDDYLVPGGLQTSEPITLHTIVSKYFFLLPRLTARHTGDNDPNPRKKLKRDAEEKDENKAITVDPKLTADKINNKNHKGETRLHIAAMKNNVFLLKQMLTVPGVDVNSQDYAGWTPLHEACNHGHVECVRALLKFVPSATLDSFFSAGTKGKKVRKVDLNLSNNEGITALHDAVLMNHINVVKLLLKYGGCSLLKAKTVLEYTAVDLAQTEEMRQLLTRDTLDLSLSQESFTQEQDSQERESVPSSFMYREVVDSSDSSTQLSASSDEIRKFLMLLTMLVRAHLQVQQQTQQQLQSEQQNGQLVQQQSQQNVQPVQQQSQQNVQLVQQQSQQQSQQQQNGPSQNHQDPEMCGESMKFYVQTFKRHVKKITSEDVFCGVRVQLCILEALLTKSC
ncbi:hypothetical protein ACOMHN_032497 [Nucella lapillus]